MSYWNTLMPRTFSRSSWFRLASTVSFMNAAVSYCGSENGLCPKSIFFSSSFRSEHLDAENFLAVVLVQARIHRQLHERRGVVLRQRERVVPEVDLLLILVPI